MVGVYREPLYRTLASAKQSREAQQHSWEALVHMKRAMPKLLCSQTPASAAAQAAEHKGGVPLLPGRDITMEGSHASMQKASKLAREPCADGRCGKGPVMRRDPRWRQHMMTAEEGRHMAVRHAVLQRRQSGPRQQAALVALRARHDCWEACRVSRRSSARLHLCTAMALPRASAMAARAGKRKMQDGPGSACRPSSTSWVLTTNRDPIHGSSQPAR